ncbi:110R [Yaba monkey tumor virus]|uniref:Transcript termination protein A18 n=1 Tax=Yaba monkey tumor virus (strain VR587) TaxID=928314 RepID=A18_YMTV5|nr:110R [Yaba monkey tumor virus]Q6TUQ9.1 RecName: Full=Transcript termination protein A18 [Yaba monkey tumor virus strain VR587]AAR07466.1 110R [Yaba monkey tumor virus]
MSVCTEIDYKLYTELRKIAGNSLFLFNEDGDFVEVVSNSSFKFLLPVGLFSSMDIPLKKPIECNTDNDIEHSKNVVMPNLYPFQERVASEVLSSIKKKVELKRPMYVTLHLACGFGKTITTCYLLSVHKKKAVICLPNKMLINQWKRAIESININHLVSVDGVGNLLKELVKKPADILIIVSRHLSNKEFCKKIHVDYDVFVLDESHMYNLMNNSTVTRFLTYYPPKICYFLTATPRRVNRIYCNDVINVSNSSDLKKYIKIVEFFFETYSSDTIRQMVKKLNTNYNKYHMYTEKILAEDVPRNKLILDTIIYDFEKMIVNRLIIVTKLRKHMMFFYTNLIEKFGSDIVYLGDAKNKNISDIVKKIKSINRFIFISTTNYSGTGLDVPTLDSLVICSAVMNSMQIEQILGRICRYSISKTRTVIVFPNTSIKEIKHMIGFFTQKIITLAIEKLGFKKIDKKGNKQEFALCKAFNLQTR